MIKLLVLFLTLGLTSIPLDAYSQTKNYDCSEDTNTILTYDWIINCESQSDSLYERLSIKTELDDSGKVRIVVIPGLNFEETFVSFQEQDNIKRIFDSFEGDYIEVHHKHLCTPITIQKDFSNDFSYDHICQGNRDTYQTTFAIGSKISRDPEKIKKYLEELDFVKIHGLKVSITNASNLVFMIKTIKPTNKGLVIGNSWEIFKLFLIFDLNSPNAIAIIDSRFARGFLPPANEAAYENTTYYNYDKVIKFIDYLRDVLSEPPQTDIQASPYLGGELPAV